MYCNQCGKEIPEDSNVCMYCGSRIITVEGDISGSDIPADAERQEAAGQQQELPVEEQTEIPESARHSWKKTRIIGIELSLVRALAISVIFAGLDIFMLEDKEHLPEEIYFSFLVLLAIPITLGVMWTSFKRMEGMLTGILGGQLASVTAFFMGYDELFGFIDQRRSSESGGITAILTLAALAGLGATISIFIHFFTEYDLSKLTYLLSIGTAALTTVLAVSMYSVIYGSDNNYFGYRKEILPESAYIFHAASLICLSAIVAFYTTMFFKGMIYNEKDKFKTSTPKKNYNSNGPVMQQKQDGTADVQCSIQYNKESHTYGITVHTDMGIFVNGGRLPKEVTIEYPAGITLSIGKGEQQIYLS